MTENKDIGWMYHGTKSDVNREDYLLGKRIDKNFEKYSDAVNEQRPDAIETVTKTRSVVRTTSTDHKISALQKGVIKNEDPLVAVKVKEEMKRQEMLENPLMKMKFQKILKDMMEKKGKKKSKKDKKKKKKKKQDSSDEDSSSEDEKQSEKERKSKRSPSPAKRERSQERHHRKRSPSAERKSFRGQRRSPSNDRNGKETRRRHDLSSERETRRRSSPARLHRTDSSRQPVRRRDSYRERRPSPPERRRRSPSSDDDRLWKKQPAGKSGTSKTRNSSRSISRSKSPVRRRGHDSRSSSPKKRNIDERKRHESPVRKDRNVSPATKSRRRHDSSSPSPKKSPMRKRRENSKSPIQRSRRQSSPRKRHDTRSPSPRRKHSPERSPVRAKRRDSTPPSPKRRRSAERKHHQSEKSRSPVERSRRRDARSPSPKRRRSPEKEKSASPSPKRKRQRSPSTEEERNFDSHIPAHLRTQAATSSGDEAEEGDKPPAYYDREERERKKKFEGYGLVGVKKKTNEEAKEAENPYKLVKMPTVPIPTKKDRRRPMTEDERTARLQAMQDNVEWRDAARSKNMKQKVVEDEKEEEEEREKKAPSFIRSQLHTVSADMSMEQRLHSNKKSLQRSHGYMERKFTSR